MAAARKLDLYKEHKAEYVTPKTPVIVDAKPAKYLTITGKGAPASEEFQRCVGALYGAAYTIKFLKKSAGQDYKVCNLEGLWWGSRTTGDFATEPPESWNWKLVIRVPDFVNSADLKAAVKQLTAKGKGEETDRVKLEKIAEGKCVQVLHVGPYAEEGGTICQMLEHARARGLSFSGLHHEIYLSDPRRVPAARLRTILRHPVQ
jgi:hypothetical protein